MSDSQVFSRAWWDAAGARAANTAIAGAIPYVTLVLAGEKSPTYALSAVAAVAVASLLTSLAGLVETTGKKVSLWSAILTRSLKTFGQAAVVWVGGAVIIGDYNWSVFAVVVGGPVLITVLRTLKSYLPETEPLVVADASKIIPVNPEAAPLSPETPVEAAVPTEGEPHV